MAFYDEGEGRENFECSTPTKSTILNNFVNLSASQKLCPGAVLGRMFEALKNLEDLHGKEI